ncbi:maltose O-acetyltransferase [Sphaerotilus mobilis]|uniref:Maltose O-acetyltransferase n=1 Tax=Sphaerotilus mobilis TaxID=47994 RepID=A0A4Q7LDE0_9BURK|nr:maltose O-acetyltransferase [Sphaerotilus mobilis]
MRTALTIVFFALPVSGAFSLKSKLLKLANIKLGKHVSYCGGGALYGRGLISIGDETWISPRSVFHSNIAAAIHIGSRCDIGPSVSFIPGSHEIGTSFRRAGSGVARDIFVGDGVWIGAGCLILGGVTIGEGSVIAAGAVVTKDIPPNTLAGGVPCRMIRKLN